ELLADGLRPAERAVAAVAELAAGTGWAGMIGGQTTDILSEQLPPDLTLTREIHRYKTARLFESAGRLGAICAGAEPVRTRALADFGQCLGQAFQIADDLLDLTGTAEQMGKAVAKDAGAGKQTYPAAIGTAASRQAAERAAAAAIAALDVFGPDADDLRALARLVVERQK
ncbi:MAG: polyprenyl synthetase family protein, partial [Phycisphaerae bacterium]